MKIKVYEYLNPDRKLSGYRYKTKEDACFDSAGQDRVVGYYVDACPACLSDLDSSSQCLNKWCFEVRTYIDMRHRHAQGTWDTYTYDRTLSH